MCMFSGFFFFFQAEDGIRDPLVTGVETCALPIYDDAVDELRVRDRTALLLHNLNIVIVDEVRAVGALLGDRRSEERRVGKECRARWAREDRKKRGGRAVGVQKETENGRQQDRTR